MVVLFHGSASLPGKDSSVCRILLRGARQPAGVVGPYLSGPLQEISPACDLQDGDACPAEPRALRGRDAGRQGTIWPDVPASKKRLRTASSKGWKVLSTLQLYILSGVGAILQPVDFVLIHQGEGVIERSTEDVFTEEYVHKIFHTPGKYKVMERKDHGDYKTSKKVRDIELRMYSAEDDKSSNVIEAKIKDFEAKRESNWAGAEAKKQEPVASASSAASPSSSKPIPTDMRIIRKAGSDELMVVDGDDKEVYSGFTFDDLKRAKQGFTGEDKVVKKDLNNQSFIKYVLVFLAGAVMGALGTFAILNQKHQKEIAAVYSKLDAMQQQIQQQQMQAAPKKKDFHSLLLGEYNNGVGGPEL